MSRTAAVTYEQVVVAAENLIAEGVIPTAELLRSRLGNVGSLGTCQAHLLEWRSRQGVTQPVTRILPADVQSAVFKFIDEETTRCNGELAQQVELAKREIDDLAADNEEQANLVRQLQAKLVEQATYKAKQEGHLAQLLEELSSAREETLVERRERERIQLELSKLESRFEAHASFENELRQLRVDFEAQRQACVQAEQNAALLKAQEQILGIQGAELKVAVSLQAHIHGSDGKVQVHVKPARSLHAAVRPRKKVGGPAESGKSTRVLPASTPSHPAEEPGGPRQAKLC